MATGLQVYSQTAATNATADSNQNWAEGMAPSQVNDSARAGMASLAKWRDDNNGTLATSGTSAAFTVTTNQVEAALTAGYTVAVQFHASAGTSATLNVDGLGGKPMRIYAGTSLQGGEFVAGSIARFTYSSTGTGEWIANNLPQLGTGSVTLPKMATAAGNPAFGFDVPINFGIAATVASTILTISFKTNAGATPTSTDPVYIPFRDSTIANGGPVWATISSSVGIDTNASGASLGTQNSVPFRFWILAFNNGGTVVPALWHSGAGAASPAINPLSESDLKSTTAISSAATSAGVFYTPNGTTLSSCAYRIVGFLEYSSGLATAGTYASAPTKLQLFGPGVKKPGDIVQTTALTSSSVPITPTNASNLVQVWASASLNVANASAAVTANLRRGTTNIVTGQEIFLAGSAVQMIAGVSFVALDNPQTTSATTYNMNTAGTGFVAPSMMVQELMG